MSNPFVRSAEQVANIEDALAKIPFDKFGVGVEFETSREFIVNSLPACFEPIEGNNWASVFISKYEGGQFGEFDAASIRIPCRLAGYEHQLIYMAVMYLDTDMANVLGHEVWGENKKQGSCQLHLYGDRVYACVARHGVKIIELSAVLDEQLPDQIVTGYEGNLKAFPGVLGADYQQPPLALVLQSESHQLRRRRGAATLKFNYSKLDRLDTIPIYNVRPAMYNENFSYSWTPHIVELPEDKIYLPHMFAAYEPLEQFDAPSLFR